MMVSHLIKLVSSVKLFLSFLLMSNLWGDALGVEG